MTIYNDPFIGLPAPSEFEFEFEEARHCRSEAEHNQSRLDQAEQRINSLEAALTAIVRTLVGKGWTTSSIAYAAQTLGLNLTELGLKAPGNP